ncbi:pseudouridine synthase [Podospora conica]|nr:pseudouridine synthase [Schizothecium conicum]
MWRLLPRTAKAFTMATGPIIDGVFAINKPVGLSSAQVIRDCQTFFNPSALFAPAMQQEKASRAVESKYQRHRRSNAKRQVQVKIGHGGTLDPLATGVLILGVGKGTKSLQDFLFCTKTYETVVLFGASTDTYDRIGRIIKKGNYDNITRPAVEKALEKFRGKFKQMPPLFSALKMQGKPLYEYAREGLPIPREIETRDVDVSEMEIVEWYEPGTHNHRWPAEEADQAEKNLVGSVWKVAHAQTTGEEAPEVPAPQKQEEEAKALEDFQGTKREAEERVDALVREEEPSAKRRKTEPVTQNPAPLMSGALAKKLQGRGSNLVPPPPSPDAPPPWEGKGPPAVKIRMTVTSGFYVRSLCHDLGEALGSGAMMAELARTRQGQFVVGGANCIEYNDLLEGEEVWAPKITKVLELWDSSRGNMHIAPKPVKAEAKVESQEPKPEASGAAAPESESAPPVESADTQTEDGTVASAERVAA